MSESDVKIWDAAVRLVHWAIVILFGLSWLSIRQGWMEIHLYSGFAMLALVVFRIIWGFVGSDTARFASFVRGPAAIGRYVRGMARRQPSHSLGHNPVGALSVLALLALLAVQTTTGLVSVDTDGINSGPLAHLVSFDTGRTMAWIHGTSFEALKILAGLHVAAVVFYLLYKRENLVAPMVTGRKRVAGSGPRLAAPGLAWVLFALVAGGVWLLVTYPPRF